MTPAERARLDRESMRQVQAAIETLEATPRRDRLRRQARRAFRFLRNERYRRAGPLLQRLSRILSRAPDTAEAEAGRRILAAWQTLLPEPER